MGFAAGFAALTSEKAHLNSGADQALETGGAVRRDQEPFRCPPLFLNAEFQARRHCVPFVVLGFEFMTFESQ